MNINKKGSWDNPFKPGDKVMIMPRTPGVITGSSEIVDEYTNGTIKIIMCYSVEYKTGRNWFFERDLVSLEESEED
jgi:hypothetical protein